MSTLTLYRGDSEKIKHFEFSRTRKSCLFGQGIYLTNSKKIAETYRTKGRPYDVSSQPVTLFLGQCSTIEEALNKAVPEFAKALNLKIKDSQSQREVRWQLQLAYEEKRVLVTREFSTRYCSTVNYKYARDLANSFKVEKLFNVTLVKEASQRIGYLSEFIFPLDVVEATTIPADFRLRDNTPLEILQDSGIFGSTTLEVSALDQLPDFAGRLQGVRRALKPYGYKGFEYKGGTYAGRVPHRAFVFWDEEFVNQYKVRRYK